MNISGVDFNELLKRAIKYLVEGLMVAIAAFAIPKKSINLDEIALIALTAAATFSILDTYIPSMGVNARSGAGFGIGANLVGSHDNYIVGINSQSNSLHIFFPIFHLAQSAYIYLLALGKKGKKSVSSSNSHSLYMV